MQKRIFVPTKSTNDWRAFLAVPEKQWKAGFSARAMAYSWENAAGFPQEIQDIFSSSEIPAFQNLEMLLAIPEYQVNLKGGSSPSQNDLFVLARNNSNELFSIAVEGKVAEPFGKTMKDWDASSSKGKTERLAFLKKTIGLDEIPNHIRYQLLHRSASAILEAEKFNAKIALMLVHSFSQEMIWLDDFQEFTKLYGVKSQAGKLYLLQELNDIKFYVAWAKGNKKYLLA